MNQVILVGRISEIHKKAGKVDYLRLKVRRNYTEEPEYDYVKVIINDALSDSTLTYLKVDYTVGVKCHIHTEVKGRYGTVQTIVVETMTFINKKGGIQDA